MNIVLFSADEITRPLDRTDARAMHIKKVLKKNEGDSFEAGIINGVSGIARITAIDSRHIRFLFVSSAPAVTPPPVALIIGFPRPIQLKRLLRDVSSLGVESVYLSGTELGEKSYLQSTLIERGAAQAALIDGACQAKGTVIPYLEMYATLGDCLCAIREHEKNRALSTTEQKETYRLLFDTSAEAASLTQTVKTGTLHGKRIIAAIGSERGWTPNERNMFKNAGFSPWSLGKRILRTETAAIAATTLILAALE